MTILNKNDVTQALRLRFEEDRRYHVLRNLLPINEWPLCLYDPSLTVDARQEQQSERQKAGTLMRDMSHKRTAEDDEAVYDDLLARVRVKAEENELLWMMHEKSMVPWEDEAVREFAHKMLEREGASAYESERRQLHMDLSTLAWVLGLPAGEDDEATVAGTRRELEVIGTARKQRETPGSDTPLRNTYPTSWTDVREAHSTDTTAQVRKNRRGKHSRIVTSNPETKVSSTTLDLPVVPIGTVLPVWRVPRHGQMPENRRLHAGEAVLGEQGRLAITLSREATQPPTISEVLATLELPNTPTRRRRTRRRSGSAALPPVHLPLLLEIHLPPGACLDVEALRKGIVERLHNLISPRAEVCQPSGTPLAAQVWIVGRPDSLGVRLLQIVLSHPPEPDTTLLMRPANPWVDPPAPRLAPPEEMRELIELFWPKEEGGDGE